MPATPLPTVMHAVEIAAFGKPEVLRLCQRPLPQLTSGEVLIQVAASGINRPDVLQRKGHYAPPPGTSDLPGLEVSGHIVAAADAAAEAALRQNGLRVGDSACALLAGGGYAQYCAAPAGQCLPLPQGLSALEAAAVPETFFTVWSNVFERAHLQAGETLLVHGGSSGIGTTAIQLAAARGARVIATAGSSAKCADCLALGAQHAIHYKEEDFAEAVRRITDGRGVDVILDMVAGDYVAREVPLLAEDGRLVIIAVQGGVKAGFDAALVLRKRLLITGSTLRPRPVAFKAAIAQALLREVWPLLENGSVRVPLYRTFAAREAAAAHALMESSQHSGKIVLHWNE